VQARGNTALKSYVVFISFSYHLHSASSAGTIRKTQVQSSKGLREGEVKEKQDGGRRVVKRGRFGGEKWGAKGEGKQGKREG